MKRIIWAALAALCLVAPAHAQVDSTLAARVTHLQPGTLVRVLYSSRPVVGRVQAVSADTIIVDSTRISLASIDRVELRGRSTAKGARVGAITGAPAGAAFGTYVVLIANVACEYDCSDIGPGGYALGVLGGGAFGTLAGALVGATIGAAIPRWVDIGRVRQQVSSDNFGSASFTPVYGQGDGAAGGGFGFRASYIFQTEYIGFGPEIGGYSTGERTRTVYISCAAQVCLDTVTYDQKVLHGGAIARFGLGSDQPVEPYATLGVGLYSWSSPYRGSVQFGGYSAGAGVMARNTSQHFAAFLDARYHNNLTRSGDINPQYGLFTIGIGAAWMW